MPKENILPTGLIFPMKKSRKKMPQPWIVYEDDELTATQALVYHCLCKFQGEHADCFPSHKTIAKQCKRSLTTVKEALKALGEKGYVIVIRQKRPDGGDTSNRYICMK